MKIIFTSTLLFICACLQAQYHFYPENDHSYEHEQNTLTSLPLLPDSNKKVDVYLGDELPSQSFYKVRIIEVSSTSGNYNRLLAGLKQKAAIEGFDAIKLLGKSESLVQDNSLGTAMVTGVVAGVTDWATNESHYTQTPLVNVQTLSAVGIKYKSQLGYIDTVMKSATVTFENPGHAYNIDFNLGGTFTESDDIDAKDYYMKNISLFKHADQLFKLYLSHNNHMASPEPTSGVMKTDSGAVKYLAYADAGMHDVLVRINLPSTQFPSIKKYFVTYTRRDDNTIGERIIFYRKRHPLFKDVYSYDERNRCTGFVRYNADNNKELFKIDYTFFSQDDLPESE